MKDNVKFKILRCWLNIYVCSKNGGRGIKKMEGDCLYLDRWREKKSKKEN